ncbi:hypothetical protein THAOC_16160 [Thalassiosira oceanica]|uniref:Uncharacterized protein n=1 Tax=Thalassiosira oceanica TaxID=159749 RepID=K0SYE9_THAOC|nr:hypothetical protein THAOC_16160 [Thalassiosira oceanica]|eukprot:EJK63202.1 hypothetical protein THAOC_16160 [Thalassiosira oceanica]
MAISRAIEDNEGMVDRSQPVQRDANDDDSKSTSEAKAKGEKKRKIDDIDEYCSSPAFSKPKATSICHIHGGHKWGDCNLNPASSNYFPRDPNFQGSRGRGRGRGGGNSGGHQHGPAVKSNSIITSGMERDHNAITSALSRLQMVKLPPLLLKALLRLSVFTGSLLLNIPLQATSLGLIDDRVLRYALRSGDCLKVAEGCIPDQNLPPIPIMASTKSVNPAITVYFGLEVECGSTPPNYTARRTPPFET